MSARFDWGGFSLADDVHRERLIREIAEKGYDLVFGDPLDSLVIEGVGSPEDTRKFLALMKQTGLGKSVAWWLNTHPRKEETKEALNEIAGAWGGKPDTVFVDPRDGGLPPLFADSDRCCRGGTDGVPPRKPSNRTAPLGPMVEREKAPSGLEPLYEALQASA